MQGDTGVAMYIEKRVALKYRNARENEMGRKSTGNFKIRHERSADFSLKNKLQWS